MSIVISDRHNGEHSASQRLRDELRLPPGDVLEMNLWRKKSLCAWCEATRRCEKRRGICVYSAGEPLSDAVVQDTLRRVRRERDEESCDAIIRFSTSLQLD